MARPALSVERHLDQRGDAARPATAVQPAARTDAARRRSTARPECPLPDRLYGLGAGGGERSDLLHRITPISTGSTNAGCGSARRRGCRAIPPCSTRASASSTAPAIPVTRRVGDMLTTAQLGYGYTAGGGCPPHGTSARCAPHWPSGRAQPQVVRRSRRRDQAAARRDPRAPADRPRHRRSLIARRRRESRARGW